MLKPQVGSKRNGKAHKVKLGYCGPTKCVKIWLAFAQQCFVCDISLLQWTDFQIDHIIPQSTFKAESQKVDNSFENLCLLCPKCNMAKGKKDAKEFFGKVKFAQLKKIHKSIETLDNSQITKLCLQACSESRMFAKKYQSGIHFAKFHQ